MTDGAVGKNWDFKQMTSSRGALTAAAACVALAGCHFPGMGGAPKAPTGQVVANVDGHEVTLRELNAEMGNNAYPDPKTRKAAEQVALRNIVARIVLADAARQQGLDKTPDFALQKDRAVDTVLAQQLEQKLITAVPQPTKEDAQNYIGAHPDIFLERKVFVVDQIRMPRVPMAVLKSLEPLKTLEEIEAVLSKDNIPHQRGDATLDAVGADPRLIDFVLKLPPNEVFVLPSNDGLLVNRIKETKVVPFTGDPSVQFATKWLTRTRTQDAVGRAFNQYLKAAEPKIQFNKDYAPPKPVRTAAAAPGTATAPAAPAAAQPAAKP
jgi:EpsD family peptidyl-prolyl cis-trans isomerase